MTEEAAEPQLWTPPLIRWAFDELPRWTETEEAERVDALRKRWDDRVLDTLQAAESRSRVHTIESLTRTTWHPDVASQAVDVRRALFGEATVEDLIQLGGLALESGHLRIVEQEDLGPCERVAALTAERDNIDDIRRGLRLAQRSKENPLDADTRDTLRPLTRRLGALSRRLRNQADEAILAQRLEGVFGRRPVAWFSRLTFFLLVLLLGLLVVDLFVADGSPLKRALRWIDTGICAVFLWEFAWRLAFAPRRLSWFLRHFLTDFVPALPFALLMDTTAASQVVKEGSDVWVRLVRFLRVPLYARYIRFLKPVVGFFRLIVFWVRGMDRLVHGLAPLLNRSVVLFEPPPERTQDSPRKAERTYRERGVEHHVTTNFERLSPQMRREAAPDLVNTLTEQVETFLSPEFPECQPEAVVEMPSTARSARFIRAEDLAERLQSLQAEDVEERLPIESVRSIGRLLALADIPPLRWLPFVGGIVRAGRGATPADRVAHAGRALGDHCQRAVGFVTGWADLNGVLTPTQILDRIATALMKSTQRPAIRLLLFGTFFVFVKLTFEALPSLRMDGLVKFLDKFVATPLLVLGTVCLVLLLTARWLKKIAGEASERLVRSSEARFVNLLELYRRMHEEADREAVVSRLVGVHLREAAELDVGVAVAMDELRGRSIAKGELASPHCRKLALLILDYQDGAFLHKSDTKIAEQFLSSPDLWSLRNTHLRIGRAERRRLAKLDLESGGLFSGPYLWFDLVTHALAVKVARLCTSYNIHLIPKRDWDHATDEERARHRALVEATRELRAEPGIARPFRSSRFHVLHFFDPHERWLREIEADFGSDVVARMVEDRAMLIREVFGTRGLHHLPEDQRSFNPLDFYQEKLGGGRILLLPFKIVIGWLRLTWFLGKTAFRSARDILDPRIKHGKPSRGVPFSVARRKIRRLKKPLLFAIVHLAARTDPEYLGLDQDGSERDELGHWEHDLRLCEPTPGEVARIRRARDVSAGRLLYLPEFLQSFGGDSLGRHAHRRLACAFAMDEGGIARMAAAERRARAWLYGVDRPDEVPPGALPRVKLDIVHAIAKRGLKRLLEHLGRLSRREVRFLRRAFRDNLGDFRIVCQAFAEAGTLPPLAAATELAERFVRDRRVFLERLETLQTLLTLSVRDLHEYERLIQTLGQYDQSDATHEPPAKSSSPLAPSDETRRHREDERRSSRTAP